MIAALVSLVLAGAPPSLEAARRDEIEALQSERDALARSLSQAESSAAVARKALEAEIDALSDSLERVQLDNARRERSLPVAEQARARSTQHRQLGELQQQIDAWLLQRGLATPPGEGPERLPQGFAAALAAITADAALRVEPAQTWFDTDGTAHTGAVLRIGRVAAASWDARAQPLVATAWGLEAAAGVAGERREHGGALQLRVVLQDPDSTVDARAWLEPDWRQTMDRGGPLMWVLLAFGLVAVAVAAERALAIAWLAARWRAVLRRVAPLAQQPAAARVDALAREHHVVAQPLVVVLSPLRAGTSRAQIEERATQAVIAVRERLLQRLSLLSLVAAVAPLAGLLGTVNGMITTFSVVTDKGTSDAQQLAGGISEALLTTQFGLTIAIPALVAHALLNRGARRVLVAIEQAVLQHIHGIAHGDGGDHDGHDHDH
ncbi:MAG: MotA/TolQ/ExbB proton channel family protein, partial [Nannocystaceae bacterium]|nr:MotA/TolQ/ExbB proton channel family protein [Nannocystaceae bacterium]